MNSRSETPEWQRRLKQKLGENPARFLDHDLVERGNRHTDHTLQRLVRARIRGIDRLEVVNAWIAVERKLARGPRDLIIELLEDRKQYLEAHGERPDDLRSTPAHELPERYQPTDRDSPDKECYIITSDGERVPIEERPTSISTGGRAFDSLTSPTEVATDGGESA